MGNAFALSLLINAFVGPQVMAFHRLEDSLILWEWSFVG